MKKNINNFEQYSRSSKYRIIANLDLPDEASSSSDTESRSSASFANSVIHDNDTSDSSSNNYFNVSEIDYREIFVNQIDGEIDEEIENQEEYLEAAECTDSSAESINSLTDDEFLMESEELSTDDYSSDSSSNNFSSDDSEEFFENANAPLYPGAPLTLGESIISILKVAVRFKVTGALLAHLLELIAYHCIEPNNCPNTLYRLKKFFAKVTTPLIRHYYCTICNSKLEENYCQPCNNRDNISYFLEISLIEQLQKLYKREDFKNNLSYRFERRKENNEHFEDIYDGSIYNSLPEDFSNNRNNITFTWNTDGVPLFKSSKTSIWPFFLMVNELPYNLRVKKENILLAGLWFGSQKPLPNLFMGAFINELELLYQGVDINIPNCEESLRIRAMIISGTCDLCAKALFMNVKQYNSMYGCPDCKIRTRREQNVTVYPMIENLELRNTQETRLFATDAHESDSSVFGVKGPTVLDKIVYNYVEATAIDEMHNTFQGITKRLLSFWFDADFRMYDFSLLPFINIVNSRIESLTLLSVLPRIPRKVSDYAYWKASELVVFLLIYSLPVLKNIMTPQYFNHHILLVYAITLLNLSSISKPMIDEAEILLKEYVSQFENLYGLRYMSCNIHLLLHLPENVRKFGPLWVMTCFPFENLNGVLKSFVHGSRYPQLQICSSVILFLSLKELEDKFLRPNSQISRFCKRVAKSGISRYKRIYLNEASYAIGALIKPKLIPQEILNVLNNYFQNEDFSPSKCQVFYRLLQKGRYYETDRYAKKKRTNSTFIKYNYNGEQHFGILNYFIILHKCANECDERCKAYAIIIKCELQNAFECNFVQSHVPNIYTCKKLEHDLRALCLDSIISTCYYFNVQNIYYVIETTNLTEHAIM